MAFGLLGQLIGLILILLGGFLAFFLQTTDMHQPKEFSLTGIYLGLLFLVLGFFLLLF